MNTLVLIFSIFTLPSFLTSTEAVVWLFTYCPNTTTFTPNSTFQSNVNRLLSNLSSNANRSSNGFYNVTVQTTNNAVYGLFLCRGDVVGTDACGTCVANATAVARQRCPVEKRVVIWYDECMLRYSNESFFSTVTDWPGLYMRSTQNATDPTFQFNKVIEASVNQAASEAVGDADKFGTNQANVTGLISVYSLGQCTQDLSAMDCNRCLRRAIALLPGCCYGRLGGRYVFPSCNVRYEVYPFYAQNASSAPEPAPGPPPPPLPPPKGKSKIPTSTIVAIVVPISASVLLFVVGYCCITRRAKYKYNEAAADEPSGENDITTVESLQFDFATIQAATSNFSDDHNGYMSPEYAMHGHFSVKSDLYSFGVLVLEIVSGKKNSYFFQTDPAEDLMIHAWKLWRDGTPLELLDPCLRDSYSRTEVIRCIHIGLLCVQENPADRPTIQSVILMLTSYSVTLPLPQQQAFFLRSRAVGNMSEATLDSAQSINKSSPSVYEGSITELYPR
ncbi:hypothetical protein DVH24_017054 [Malus domestica]|uniref:Gnk2-homologous domain-containing protein n=1 Tax=Malus domestica TaxID=3750 RepID=A0A498IXJ2_MALDO|nr:hypothetical protein DVH24_017054 [Malus domestica]